MSAVTGPKTVNADNIGLGLAQIRVYAEWKDGGGSENSEELVSKISPELDSSLSIGKLSGTKMNLTQEYHEITSGTPKTLDRVVPLSAEASFEGSLFEITPKNIELALGKKPETATANAGLVGFGKPVAPIYARMEAWFVFPDGKLAMIVILPKCQVVSSFELNMSEEGEMNIPAKFKATDCSSSNSDITTSVWDDMPLGCILIGDVTDIEAAANLGSS